jgi:hypothetical protein
MNPETTGFEPIWTLAAIGAIVVFVFFLRAVYNTIRGRDEAAAHTGDFLYSVVETLRELWVLFAQHGKAFAGLRRAAAIAGNTVREAVRRKILWVVPVWLAVTLGVAAFIRPLDEEQDRYALLMKLFLYGQLAVVVGATMLTAVSDLGNERRRKTLLTLLVKPVTRLELVIGKIAGQAMIAAVLLAGTGTATAAYFAWVDHGIRTAAQARYDEAERLHDADPTRRAPEAALKVLAREGVLGVREVRGAADLRITALDLDGIGWMRSGSGQRAAAIFGPVRGSPEQPPIIQANFRVRPILHMLLRDRPDRVALRRFPVDLTFTAIVGPLGDPRRVVSLNFPMQLTEELRDEFNPLIARDRRLTAGLGRVWIDAAFPNMEYSVTALFPLPLSLMGFSDNEGRRVDSSRLEVNVMCNYSGLYLGIRPADSILITGVAGDTPDARAGMLLPQEPVELRGSQLRKRQSIMGVADDQNPEMRPLRDERPGRPILFPPDKAIWTFAGIRPAELEEGRPAELRIKGVVDVNDQAFSETLVRLDFASDDGKFTWTHEATLEENRPLIIKLPEGLLTGRPFRTTFTCRSTGHSVALDYGSAQLTVSQMHFTAALARSTAVIWMQAVVLAALGVFASTFLSWPIAILLTAVCLLLGVVKPLLLPLGVGHELWRALYVMTPQMQETDVLLALKWLVWVQGKIIAATAFVAPDVREFNEFDWIARSTAVPSAVFLRDAFWAAFYVLPLLVFSYWVMRWKEAGE